MRTFVAGLAAFISILTAAPSGATVTLAPVPLSAQQKVALDKAQAVLTSMEAGVRRHQAAAFIAYRLMTQGDCSQALSVMAGELRNVSDFKAIGGLMTGAIWGRDPRCLTWVADRTDALLRTEPFSEEQRAELRVRGRTAYLLAGWLGRASRLPPADLDTLDVVPRSWSHQTFLLDNIALHVHRSDAPTRLEVLLMDRLFAFRGTPLQLHFARVLARHAKTDPKYFRGTGWMEVARILLDAGDEAGAKAVLESANEKSMTIAGLKAESALRRRDYQAAANIFGNNDWMLKSNSAVGFARRRPDVLVPYMENLFSPPIIELSLASFSEALDAKGHHKAAKIAAERALSHFGSERYGLNRKAQMLARLGHVADARALLADAMTHPAPTDPIHFRVGIAIGTALAENLAEVKRTLNDAPGAQRDYIFVKTLASLNSTRSPVREWLEKKLEQRLDEEPPFSVSPDALAAFASTGIAPSLATKLLARQEPSRTIAAQAIRAASAAMQGGHRETALAFAEAARRLVPSGPQGDAELVELSGLYWWLGLHEEAATMAMKVSVPEGQVDALTRALTPTREETRQNWSFQLF